MSLNKKPDYSEEKYTGSITVKVLKLIALVAFFVMFIFADAALATVRSNFGYRGFLTYAGIGLISGVLIFELAEIIRLLEKLYKRFDLYDKID